MKISKQESEKKKQNIDDALIMWKNATLLKGLHSVLCVCDEGKICPEHNGLKVTEIPYYNSEGSEDKQKKKEEWLNKQNLE